MYLKIQKYRYFQRWRSRLVVWWQAMWSATQKIPTQLQKFLGGSFIFLIIVHFIIIIIFNPRHFDHQHREITIPHPPLLFLYSSFCHYCFFRLHWWEIVFPEIVDSIWPLVDNCHRLVNKSSEGVMQTLYCKLIASSTFSLSQLWAQTSGWVRSWLYVRGGFRWKNIVKPTLPVGTPSFWSRPQKLHVWGTEGPSWWKSVSSKQSPNGE